MNLTLPCPAKLNLFLHVTGRRDDGYHELQTLFQLLDWGDTLHIAPRSDGELVFEGPDLGIPTEDNLVMRAARKLQRKGQGATLRLTKVVPSGGGLGGGSSDAATTLLGLNRLWGLGLTLDELAELGRELGADVPVFVQGHSAWAEGVGELLTPVDLPERWYLVLRPDCAIATAEIFSHRELTRNSSPITIAAFFAGDSRNDCQNVACELYPEVAKALKWLGNFGEARLTGTGSACFASFPDQAAAEAVLAQLPLEWSGWVARGINQSPVHPLLD